MVRRRLGIVQGRDDPHGFVEGEIPGRSDWRDGASVDFDARVRLHAYAHLAHDAAVHAHASRSDQRVGVAARCDPRMREERIQSDRSRRRLRQ